MGIELALQGNQLSGCLLVLKVGQLHIQLIVPQKRLYDIVQDQAVFICDNRHHFRKLLLFFRGFKNRQNAEDLVSSLVICVPGDTDAYEKPQPACEKRGCQDLIGQGVQGSAGDQKHIVHIRVVIDRFHEIILMADGDGI